MTGTLLRAVRSILAAAIVLATAAVVIPASPAGAQVGSVVVSEVAPWSSGNSPVAADWFELTNVTASPVNIAGWRMDDDSNTFSPNSVGLNGISSIAPGESVIFVETSSITTVNTFKSNWFGASPPSGLQVGTYTGTGVSLSTGGDAVVIFDSLGNRITGVRFPANPPVSPTAPPYRSWDNAAGQGGTSSTTSSLPLLGTLSSIGTNGAFTAANNANEIGSPGTTGASSGGTTTTSTTTTSTTTTTIAGPAYSPWPGGAGVSTVDVVNQWTSNLSGLDYEGTGSSVPGVIWAVVNGPGSLHRLVFTGTNWVPDTGGGWASGKTLRYGDGTGDPDAEGVTFVGNGASQDGIYVSTERNNAASGTSRNAILRFDPTQPGATLSATNEWNITSDIPANAPNLGLEAITWIPDYYLTSNGLIDDNTGTAYNPADYPGHGAGLFLVGVEGTGTVHVYALKSNNTFNRITSFNSGFSPSQVMDLQFDLETGNLWAVCDNNCNGRANVFQLNAASGKFDIVFRFERPGLMPNLNNEGFAIAPQSYCTNGVRPVYWADDGATGGFSLREGTLNCDLGGPQPIIPEFPLAVLPALVAAACIGGWFLRRRRIAGLS